MTEFIVDQGKFYASVETTKITNECPFCGSFNYFFFEGEVLEYKDTCRHFDAFYMVSGKWRWLSNRTLERLNTPKWG